MAPLGLPPGVPADVVDGTYGALFLGLLLSTMLYGVACTQSIIYFHQWTKDRPLFKNLVSGLLALDTVQLLLVAYTIYNWLITNYGDFSTLGRPSPATLAQICISGMSDLIVRSFFARRAFILLEGRRKKNRFLASSLAALIVVLSVFVYFMSVAYCARIFAISSGPPGPDTFIRIKSVAWMNYTFNAASAVVDLIVALALCVILAKNRTGFLETDNVVVKLMIFSISSGMVTSLFALTSLIIYAALPQYLISLGLNYVVCQLHFNSLLVSLNARTVLRERHGEPSSSGAFTNEVISFPDRRSTQYAIPLREASAQVTISKEVTIDSR